MTGVVYLGTVTQRKHLDAESGQFGGRCDRDHVTVRQIWVAPDIQDLPGIRPPKVEVGRYKHVVSQ